MREQVAGVQPSVLQWAREAQGYSVEDVAERLKRKPEEVRAWELGESAPTYAQLEDLAYRIYKRPLAVFFLPAPPSEPNPRQEFRTLPDTELDALTADTRYQLRLAHAYQLSLHDLNDGVNPAARKIFREHRLSVIEPPERAAVAVRLTLEVALAAQLRWRSTDEALKAWRNAVEERGIYVFKNSFRQRSISGFSLFDEEFPVIVLNNSAAKSRQIFSLFHELCHVLLHSNSITTFDDGPIERLPEDQRRIERYCNVFAAEVLLPSDTVNPLLRNLRQVDEQAVTTLADRFHVSRETVLRRALDLTLVDRTYYQTMVRRWADEATPRGEGGNYYATQSTYLGEKFLQLVFGQYYQGTITREQVSDYLGIKSKSVDGMEAMLLGKAV